MMLSKLLKEQEIQRRPARVPFQLLGLGDRGEEPTRARWSRPRSAHVIQNKVEVAYARSDLFEVRRRPTEERRPIIAHLETGPRP